MMLSKKQTIVAVVGCTCTASTQVGALKMKQPTDAQLEFMGELEKMMNQGGKQNHPKVRPEQQARRRQIKSSSPSIKHAELHKAKLQDIFKPEERRRRRQKREQKEQPAFQDVPSSGSDPAPQGYQSSGSGSERPASDYSSFDDAPTSPQPASQPGSARASPQPEQPVEELEQLEVKTDVVFPSQAESSSEPTGNIWEPTYDRRIVPQSQMREEYNMIRFGKLQQMKELERLQREAQQMKDEESQSEDDVPDASQSEEHDVPESIQVPDVPQSYDSQDSSRSQEVVIYENESDIELSDQGKFLWNTHEYVSDQESQASEAHDDSSDADSSDADSDANSSELEEKCDEIAQRKVPQKQAAVPQNYQDYGYDREIVKINGLDAANHRQLRRATAQKAQQLMKKRWLQKETEAYALSETAQALERQKREKMEKKKKKYPMAALDPNEYLQQKREAQAQEQAQAQEAQALKDAQAQEKRKQMQEIMLDQMNKSLDEGKIYKWDSTGNGEYELSVIDQETKEPVPQPAEDSDSEDSESTPQDEVTASVSQSES